MKRQILLLSLALLCLVSCNTDELTTTHAPLPKELLGRWAPETNDYSCDRYIEFESGQCYTYLNPFNQYFIDGYIHLTLSQFNLMSARYCHLTEDTPAHLVLDGKDAGTLLLFPEIDPATQSTEEVLVINQERYRRVKGILQESSRQFAKVELDAGQFDIPEEKTLILETGKSASLTYKLYLEGQDEPLESEEAALYINFVSMDEKIATVDEKGTITPHKNGNVTLKVRTYDVSCTDICQLIVSGGDLSQNGTANCYVANNPGHYRFVMAKGNGEKNVGNVSGVKVLWETFNTAEKPTEAKPVITNVRLSEGKDSIYFDVPTTMNNGNAVIAATDASDNILWSWHIWACKSFDPAMSAQVYNNNAGTVMDRNLGALTPTPGDATAMGLVYQWGRKDPFPSTTHTVPSASVKRASTSNEDQWEFALTSTPPTPEESQGKPMSFYTYWSAPEGTELWQDEKTVYDPCPPGWKVASYNLLTKAIPEAAANKYRLVWPRLSSCYAFDLGSKVSASPHVYYPLTACILVNDKDINPTYTLVNDSTNQPQSLLWCNKRYSRFGYCIWLDFRTDAIDGDGNYLLWNTTVSYVRCRQANGNAVRCMME